MAHPEGGFYASEDADSDGEEGKFYVWTPAEVRAALGESDGGFACRAYGVTEHGNFEHGATVLSRAIELDTLEEARLGGLRGSTTSLGLRHVTGRASTTSRRVVQSRTRA
jgi:uncharacterized protein YyaL (SSP411 family)